MPCSSNPSASHWRAVIGQRERTIALRAMQGGLVAHTLDEQRDINEARSVFGDIADIKTDPEMVALAKQLIQRQTTTYDPSDLEDRYESSAAVDDRCQAEGRRYRYQRTCGA
jgi:DNA end-binding protein Ku